MYHLTIIKAEQRTEEEMSEIKEARKWGRDIPYTYPTRLGENYKEVKTLEASLTEAEFQEVKKSVLAIM